MRPAEPDFFDAIRCCHKMMRTEAAVDRDRVPARDDIGHRFTRRLPTRHVQHVPEPQKLYGNTDFAVSIRSGSTPTVPSSRVRAWAQ